MGIVSRENSVLRYFRFEAELATRYIPAALGMQLIPEFYLQYQLHEMGSDVLCGQEGKMH